MRIKAFVFLFVMCSLCELVVLQSAGNMASYKDNQEACIKELKIGDAEAAQIAGDEELTNPSDAYKCFHNCLYRKFSQQSADDKPDSEALLKYAQIRLLPAPLDKIKQQFPICMAAHKKDVLSCEFIYSYEQCMVKALRA